MQSRTLLTLCTALSCLVLSTAVRSQSTQSIDKRAETKSSDSPPIVTWRELADHPGRYTNKHLRLVLQFQAHVATWNPYLTRFGTRDFNAFQFWGDEQRLWSLAEFQSPPVRLFARKRSTADWALEAAQPYVRFEVEVVVRDIFLDQPWAEIESVKRLDEHVAEGTLIHAARALELMETKSWKLAENELDQAVIGALPQAAKRDLEKLRDDCRQRIDPRDRTDPKPAPVLRGKAPPVRQNN